MKRFLFGIFFLPFLLAGVLGCQDPQETEIEIESEALSFELIGQGVWALPQDTVELPLPDPTFATLLTEAEWLSFAEDYETVLPFKSVDFEQAMVLFAAVPFESSGHIIEFESVEIVEDELVASYRVGKPGSDCRVIDIQAAPFQAVAVRRLEAPVRFEQRVEITQCTEKEIF